MGRMSDDPQRVHVRNVTNDPIEVGPSAYPSPAIVPPDGITEVDAWAVESLTSNGLFKRATKADAKAAADAAAARLDELAATDTPPAAERADTNDDGES